MPLDGHIHLCSATERRTVDARGAAADVVRTRVPARMNAIAERAPRASGSSSAPASAPSPTRSRTRSRSRTPSCPTSRRRASPATPARCSSARCPACRSACLQGRKHVYEGGDPGAMRGPVRALKAARRRGAVRHQRGRLAATPTSVPGSLMAINDHINMLGVNPLTGPNDDAIGPRFPSLRDAYDPELRAVLQHRRDRARHRRSPRASTSRRPARASRPRPRSARSARSAPTPSACRPSPR